MTAQKTKIPKLGKIPTLKTFRCPTVPLQAQIVGGKIQLLFPDGYATGHVSGGWELTNGSEVPKDAPSFHRGSNQMYRTLTIVQAGTEETALEFRLGGADGVLIAQGVVDPDAVFMPTFEMKGHGHGHGHGDADDGDDGADDNGDPDDDDTDL